MYITDFYLSMILGVTIALLFVEYTGVNPGGMIIPGYLALKMEEPITMLVISLVSLITFAIIQFIFQSLLFFMGVENSWRLLLSPLL